MKEKLLIITLLLVCCIAWLYADREKEEFYDLYNINRRKMIPYTYKQRSTPVGASVGVQKDRSAEARRQDNLAAVEKYLSRLNNDPHNKKTLYKLSVSYAQLNEPELSAYYVTQAYLNGYHKLKRFEKSRKFQLVRDNPIFINTLESLKSMQTEGLRQPDLR